MYAEKYSTFCLMVCRVKFYLHLLNIVYRCDLYEQKSSKFAFVLFAHSVALINYANPKRNFLCVSHTYMYGHEHSFVLSNILQFGWNQRLQFALIMILYQHCIRDSRILTMTES